VVKIIEVGLALIFIGISLIFIGIILEFIHGLLSREKLKDREEEEVKVERKAAGVIIIGPFPILIASDKETARMAIILTVIALVFFLAFFIISILLVSQ